MNGIVLLRTCIISFYDMTVKLYFARYLWFIKWLYATHYLQSSLQTAPKHSKWTYGAKINPYIQLTAEKWTYTEKSLSMSILFLIYGHMENISSEISNKSRQNGHFWIISFYISKSFVKAGHFYSFFLYMSKREKTGHYSPFLITWYL